MTRPAATAIDAVVIGTSAGGIDALSVLLPAFSPRLRAAVFVVLHLPPQRPSLLVDLFQPRCRVAVREALDKEPVAPGTIYFAPPDYHLLIDSGPQLALSMDEPVNFSRPSIDVLFESAADVYGRRALGIILTGASHDGSAGLAAIHRAGGRTIVQQSDEAYASIMIEAAIRLTPVDRILPLAGIAAHLADLDREGLL
jgi:two-component system, chemotaxis family, protein-glutamate methylesterase/glutaminase